MPLVLAQLVVHSGLLLVLVATETAAPGVYFGKQLAHCAACFVEGQEKGKDVSGLARTWGPNLGVMTPGWWWLQRVFWGWEWGSAIVAIIFIGSFTTNVFHAHLFQCDHNAVFRRILLGDFHTGR